MPPLNSFFCADWKHLLRRRWWRKLLPSTSLSSPSSSWLPSPSSLPSSAIGLPSPWMSIWTQLCHCLFIIFNCTCWHLYQKGWAIWVCSLFRRMKGGPLNISGSESSTSWNTNSPDLEVDTYLFFIDMEVDAWHCLLSGCFFLNPEVYKPLWLFDLWF